jgi:endogenous inhibitor of DNA gyrase (YacG/DUF329 family)
MSRYVPETAIDYEAVFRRGGKNFEGEDFALFKCPNCGRVYLLEYEVDTVYIDGSDLTQRVNVTNPKQPFCCIGCSQEVPQGPWAGPRVKEEFLVTWQELSASAWSWVATPLSSFGDET